MHEEPTSSRGSSPERDEDLAQVLLRNIDNVATRNSEQSLSQIGDVNINMHVNPFCLASSSTISRGPSSGDIGRGETRAAGGEPTSMQSVGGGKSNPSEPIFDEDRDIFIERTEHNKRFSYSYLNQYSIKQQSQEKALDGRLKSIEFKCDPLLPSIPDFCLVLKKTASVRYT